MHLPALPVKCSFRQLMKIRASVPKTPLILLSIAGRMHSGAGLIRLSATLSSRRSLCCLHLFYPVSGQFPERKLASVTTNFKPKRAKNIQQRISLVNLLPVLNTQYHPPSPIFRHQTHFSCHEKESYIENRN